MAATDIVINFWDRVFGLDGNAKRNLILGTGGRIAAKGRAYTATAAVVTDGANATKVTVTVKDVLGAAIGYVENMDLWLSDASSGAGLTATTASGTVAAKGTAGADLAVLTTKKALRVQTDATGVYALSITDTAKTAFKVCVAVGGATVVVATLSAASYA